MALDISKIQSRLKDLSSVGNPKTKMLWKPTPGKKVIRIVPNAQTPDNPFVELKFHYNLNGKTYLSPDTFNRPDPIVEFSNKMKTTGDKDEWKLGKKLEPKMRTYAPIIVRGEEDQGVKFWGFGKKVYESILSVLADPDFGDITDLATGRDITIEFKSAEEAGKDYPETTIRVKPNQSPAVDPTRKDLIEKIKNQPNLLDCWQEHSYDELKSVMNAWLHPVEDEESSTVVGTTYHAGETQDGTETPAVTTPVVTLAEKKTTPADMENVFDNLFGKKKAE